MTLIREFSVITIAKLVVFLSCATAVVCGDEPASKSAVFDPTDQYAWWFCNIEGWLGCFSTLQEVRNR